MGQMAQSQPRDYHCSHQGYLYSEIITNCSYILHEVIGSGVSLLSGGLRCPYEESFPFIWFIWFIPFRSFRWFGWFRSFAGHIGWSAVPEGNVLEKWNDGMLEKWNNGDQNRKERSDGMMEY